MNDSQKILQTYNIANQIKVDVENEREGLEKLDPAPQVVIICGGHVEEICFETKGGIVLCEGGATVGRIVKLECE